MRLVIATLIASIMVFVMTVSHAQEDTESVSYEGKTALVTGSTDGLGREIARALAAQGAHVIVHGRNAERGEALVAEIAASGTGSAKFYPADFGSMQAVRDFADTIARDYPRLDLLVNNAGILVLEGTPPVSADGYDLTFAVNYLSNWILVNRLRPNLAAAAPSRVINISSISAAPIDFADVMMKDGDGLRAYGQSKLAQVTMTRELAPSFLEDGITMVSLHPATLMNTSMVEEIGMAPQASVEEGRDHVMRIATAADLEPGAFYVEGKVAEPYDSQPDDPEARRKLVALSNDLTGVAIAAD